MGKQMHLLLLKMHTGDHNAGLQSEMKLHYLYFPLSRPIRKVFPKLSEPIKNVFPKLRLRVHS